MPATDLGMDFQNLISCIECHKEEDNIEVIIETMKTIVNICTAEELGKDGFREVGGLDFLVQFVMDTDQVTILEYGLKVLAFVIDGNIHSQMYLTEDKVFKILQTIFKKKTYPLKVLKNAVVLFSTLLFQNRYAQDIIQENESLLSLIELYRCFSPIHTNSNTSEDSDYLDIWLAINSSLCFAVNNPLHEKNQNTCSTLFPLSLRIIETASNPNIIEATSSFLSLSIANSETNQDAFAELDGFLILKRSLNKEFEEIQTCMKECNNIISKRTMQIINSLISVISAAVSDHEENAVLCGKLRIVSLITDLLSTKTLCASATKKILLLLGYCVDACDENRFMILEVPHLDALLKESLNTDDPELFSTARYLLQVCLNEFNTDLQNDPNQGFYHSDINKSSLGSYHHKHKVLSQLGSSSDLKKNILYEENYCDTSNKCLNLGDSTSSGEDIVKGNGANNELYPEARGMKITTDHQSAIDKHQLTQNEMELNKSDNSDSIGDISLQSAGHLHRLFQMNLTRLDRNTPKSIREKGKCIKHYADDERCNSDNRQIGISDDFILSSNRKCSLNSEKLTCTKEKILAGKVKTDKKKKCIDKESKHQDLSECGNELLPDSRSKYQFMKSNNQSKDLSFDKVQPENRVLPTTAGPNNSTTIRKENSRPTSEKSSVDIQKPPTEKRKLSAKMFSIDLQSFHRPHSRSLTNDEKYSKPKASFSNRHRQPNTAGCMQVVVLPGTTCSEHGLAAQLELLKVYPLKKSE